MPPSHYSAVGSNPFASFGDSINVRDPKHMSIIDNPACLSPGGNTARKHTTPYRLSDLVSLGSPNASKESVVERHGTLAGGPNGREEGAEDVDVKDEEGEDPFSTPEKDGVVSGDENSVDDVKVPLKTRRTGKSTPKVRKVREEYLSDIGSGSEGGNESDASSIAHSDDARSMTSSRKPSIDGDGSEKKCSAVKNEGNEGSGTSNKSSKSSSDADVQSTPQQTGGFTENLASNLSWLWQTSAHSDLTISSGEHNFFVHKCILAAQCRHFHNKLLQDPQEVLRLDDDDPGALRSMLQYLYTGSLALPDPNLTTPGGTGVLSTLDTLLKTYELGCKYSLPDLKSEAAKQYTTLLSMRWEKGHAVFLAKVLMRIFKMADAAKGQEKWFSDGAVELREATLEVAVDCKEELVEDAVALDLLAGEALRAFVAKVVKSRACGDHGEAEGDGADSSPGMPASGCSGENFWL